MKITILREILDILPNFNIIALTMDVKVEDSKITENAISEIERKIREEYSLADVLNIPLVKEARDGYKALGKDPSRYRLACESLVRRIVKGYGLYRINNVVDAGNLLSLYLFRSTAVLDFDKIVGDITIRIGTQDDEYYGIGRGKINVDKIPLYCDEVSPFGSPTSDVDRTKITSETKRILLFVICFQNTFIEESKATAIEVFKKYAYAQNIKEIKVIKEE